MQRTQLKVQKPVMILALVMGVLTFVFALGFATDIYSLSYYTDSSSKVFYVEGAELYNNIQPYNRTLLNQSVILLLIAASNFFFMAHKRRLYYISNYLTGVAFAGFSVYIGSQLIQYAMVIKDLYSRVDFVKLKEISEMRGSRYVESTFMMDCGIVLSILLFVAAAVIIANLVVKTLWMREEKKALAASSL